MAHDYERLASPAGEGYGAGKREQRVLTLWIVIGAVAVVLLPGCRPDDGHGMVFTDKDLDVRVSAGHVFSLAVRSRSSVGDRWRVESAPDPSVAVLRREDYDSVTAYFVFAAHQPGTTRITLFDCYRCTAGLPQGDPEFSRRVTFVVTVTSG